MMPIIETLTFQVGPFTVQQRPRFDSPAWPQYIVSRGAKLIGKQFSVPDLQCCRWLERFRCYAKASVRLPEHDTRRDGTRGRRAHTRARPGRPARIRKLDHQRLAKVA